MRPIHFQPSLFDSPAATFDETCSAAERIWLDEASWIDHLPAWVQGSDALFERLVRERDWRQRARVIFEQERLEPRLTAPWSRDSGEPLDPPELERMRQSLSARYRVDFDSVGFNLYRDGADSVAWHRDRIDSSIAEPVVALVSFGSPRRLLFRPHGGGPSRGFSLGHGDLLVTGGLAQRKWEHTVPKVRQAAPRISLAFRHGLVPNSYLKP